MELMWAIDETTVGSGDGEREGAEGESEEEAEREGEDEFGEETGLGPAEADPEATSLMVDFSNSEFSRLRFQVTDYKFHEKSDNVFSIQYIMSLGAHGAHSF